MPLPWLHNLKKQKIMNDTQRNKEGMYGKVLTFFDAVGSGTVLYPLAAGLQTAVTSLRNLRTSIITEDSQATQDDTGIALMIGALRNDLILKCQRVEPALVGYFRSINDDTLRERINYTSSEYDNADRALLKDMALKIWVTGDPVKTLLMPWNSVASAEVTAVQTAMNLYSVNDEKSLEAKGKRASHGHMVDVIIGQCDFQIVLIKELMELFPVTHAQLYTEFILATGIDDLSGGGTSHTYVETVQPMSIRSVAEVNMDINESITMITTSPDGLIFGLRDPNTLLPIGSTITVPGNTTQNATLGSFAPAIPADAELYAQNVGPNPSGYEVTIG